MSEKITIVCYNRKKDYYSRKEAINFYEDAVICSDGHEQERYLNILCGLKSNETFICDKLDIVDGFEKLVKETDKVEKLMVKKFKEIKIPTVCDYFGDIGKGLVSLMGYHEYVDIELKMDNNSNITYCVVANTDTCKFIDKTINQENNLLVEREFENFRDIKKYLDGIKIKKWWSSWKC